MSWKNPPDRWGGVSQLLHWVIVVLLVILASSGCSKRVEPTQPIDDGAVTLSASDSGSGDSTYFT